MIAVSLRTLSEALGAELIGQDCTIDAVSTDTRQLASGCLFVALKGERFDAHDFIENAQQAGASAVLVEREMPYPIAQLVVKDTRLALGQLGAWLRTELAPFTLALTGSCGKTTVKEMTASILSEQANVLATAGNFNNDIGVPLTLLRLTPQHKYAVIELGANHLGEIDYTTRLVKPQVALINNLAEAHLEGFGSMQGVAKAKGEIFHGLTADGIAIVNRDSHDLTCWQKGLATHRVLTFSVNDTQADYYATGISMDEAAIPSFNLHSPQGVIAVQLSIPGQHNIANALAAAALAQQAGASLSEIRAGLMVKSDVKGRVHAERLTDTLTVIDDTYNASVAAVKAAIDLLANYQGQRVLVLGDMKELGNESAHLHQNVAEYAAEKHFDMILTYGVESRAISSATGGHHFEHKQHLIHFLKDKLASMSTQSVTVLVKGGRSSQMEEVVAALQETVQ
ncbi:UDP-N-acetylmuramoyl-tripeptide--D-alanyl-D-alanine ligase [Thaumasiovibrio sp. DFM-14]|uniref:UDP-N-acetylmuramoyl-tripeptide--D-alanyl-D- alanine ligase n=1 Tax=Thaumasiovibrio sp. DFM-14 TaxID=3384792 RepID=UPI0039A0FF16